jgi:hypothetical protein
MVCSSALLDALGREPNQRITDPNSQCAQILELLRQDSSNKCAKDSIDDIVGSEANLISLPKVTPQETRTEISDIAHGSEKKKVATAAEVKRSEVWLQANSIVPEPPAPQPPQQPPKEQNLEALRKQAKATLERASRNGSLASLLAKSFGEARGAKMSAVAAAATATSPSAREIRTLPTRSRRGLPKGEVQTSGEKVEDTRDLDDLLRELGEAPEVEKSKGKKKGKLVSNSSSPVAQNCSGPKTGTGMGKEAAPLSDKAVSAQSQLVTSQCAATCKRASADHVLGWGAEDAIARSTVSEEENKREQEFLPIGRWQVVPAKTMRRSAACSSEPFSADESSHVTLECTSSQPIITSPTSVERIVRKDPPVVPTGIDLQRPILGGSVAKATTDTKSKATLKFCARNEEKRIKSKTSSKPFIAEAWFPASSSSADLVSMDSSASGSRLEFPLQPSVGTWLGGSTCVRDPARTIPVWPATPESTPPTSPRCNSGEPREVLVPVPIHLLAEVQQLLLRHAAP